MAYRFTITKSLTYLRVYYKIEQRQKNASLRSGEQPLELYTLERIYYVSGCRIMKGMSREKFFIILFGMLAIRGTCNRHLSSPPRSSEITVAIEGNPTILDPRVAMDAYASRIFPLVFEGLFQIGRDYEPSPQLVDSFSTPDPLTYVFRLKPGHLCPEGTEISAEDVMYNLKSLGDPALRSHRKVLYDRIAEVSVLDRYTLRIRLKEPYAPFLTELAFGILPASPLGREPEEFLKKPFGSGPYQVESFEPGAAVKLSLNPRYHGPRPYLARITFRIVPDDVTRVLALLRGEVSLLLNSTPPDDVPLFIKDPRFKTLMEPGVNYVYLGLNLHDPILKNPPVRQAIAHAIDREKLIHCLLRDTVTPASGLLAPLSWAYNPAVQQYEYDPQKAKALLDQAGFPDPDGAGPRPRFSILFKTSQLKLSRWTAEAIQAHLQKVGIAVQIRSYEWGTYFSDIISGNFQIYSLTWVGTTDPDVYYLIFHSQSRPPNGANRNHYANPELDQLLEQARKALDRRQRKIAYSRVQEILAQDLPLISLWFNKNIVVMDQRLEGFVIYPGGDFRSLAQARWRQE